MQSDILKYKIIRGMILFNVFLVPFYFFRFSIYGIKTNIFEVFTLLIFLLFICIYSSDLTIRKLKLGNFWTYLFLLAAFVSLFFADDKVHAAGILKGWFLSPFLLFLLIVNNFNKESIKKLAIPIFLSLLIVSTWALLQKLGLFTTLFYQGGDINFNQYLSPKFRAFGPFESPNFLAMFLVPAIFLSLPLLSSTSFSLKSNMLKRGLRYLIAIAFVLPILALYFTTSRGGAVALTVSFLAFILFLYFKSKVFRKTIEGISNILIFGLIIIATIFAIYSVRIISPNQGSDNIRLEIYNYSFQLIKNFPILGIGLGNFQNIISEISRGNDGFVQFGLSYALHPHNLYMALWLNLGLLGLVAFFGLVAGAIKYLFMAKKEVFVRACVFSALIAVLVHGFFDTTYFKNDLSTIFWIIYASSFVLTRKK